MAKKRVATLVLSIALLLAVTVGGTLAYLTDTDSDVNVMTLGNVQIEQIEQQLGEDGSLEPFDQGKEFYPGTEISKIVSVQNTGKSDAYFRTLIAFEDIDSDTFGISFGFTDTDYTIVPWGGEPVSIKIGEVSYVVYEFIHNTALSAGATSASSLYEVNMANTATNEDMEKLGNTYDILVLSQAVQTEGFDDAQTALDTAFGDVNVENCTKWFSGTITEVDTAEELAAVFAEGGYARLTDDITVDNMMKLENGVEVCLDLNGQTIEFEPNSEFKPGNPVFYPLAGTKLTITGNGTVDLGDSFDAALVCPAGEVVIENGTFIRDRVPEGTDPDNVQTMFIGVKSVGSSLVIKDGYFDSGYYDANAELDFSETAADVANRGKAADSNLIRTAIKNNVSFAFNLSWSSAAGMQDFRIYGGTFVGANPAWGDEGCAMPITPDYLRPWSYYQGCFLEGQVMHDDKIVVPDGYTITESTHADGRPVYTVNYSK